MHLVTFFARRAEAEQGYLRRLFADDARAGCLHRLCSKRYDVV